MIPKDQGEGYLPREPLQIAKSDHRKDDHEVAHQPSNDRVMYSL
jgi:hypothetical protein